VCAVGTVNDSYGITPKPQSYCQKVEDPFKSLTAPSSGTCLDGDVKSNQTKTLDPGTYCGGINVQGTAKLNPGLYIVKDGPLSFGSQSTTTLNATGGVTFYIIGTKAGFDINAGAKVNLSAMTSGDYKGILIFVDRNSNVGATSTLNGNADIVLKGAIYTPGQTLVMNGSGSFGQSNDFMPIIADKLKFTGNSTVQTELTSMQTAKPLATFATGALLKS
jgi:hypothetical protein